jgi:hypothetical protein
MKIWQLVCGSVLVLNMTSCGNKEATTPPVEKPPATEAAPTTGAAPAPEVAPAATGTAPAPEAPATIGTAPIPGVAPAPGAAPGTIASAPPVKKSPATKPAPPVKKSPAPEAAAAPATSIATGPGFPALKTIISTTKKAGEAANFDAATTEFSKFEDAWKTVEDKVKAKKPAEYKAIETTVEAANMAIAKKDKTALLGSLQKLNGMVDKVSK